MNRSYDVVIVGGGPVGVALAVDLGLRGVSCAVVERRTKLSDIPKGQGLSQRTMEHFFFWGIDQELRAARTMRQGHPIGQVTVYQNLMGEFWHAPAGREVVAPYYFQANERLPQYRTEEVLRGRMAGLSEVDDYFGWRASDLKQDAAGVRVTIEKDGDTQVLEARYAVGCDGGHSMVRETADIERSGTDFDQVMALIVFRSRELHEALERFPPRSTYRVLNPELKGYWMFFGRIDVGEGFFFHAPVPPDTNVDDFDFATLLHKAAGFEFAAVIDSVGFWDLRVRVAEKYRAGRAFIAGDAAHTHPPYGGFGLNNGLEDAVNLSWKLAAVLDGWGGERLLDSYTAERRPVFRDIGENIIAAGIYQERRFLQSIHPEPDPEAFREAFRDLADGFGRLIRRYDPHYEGSPIVIGPPGAVISAGGGHVFRAQAGHHLVPQPLSNGRDVFEELGPGFTLLALGAEGSDVAALEEAAASMSVPMTTIRDTFDGGREAYEQRLILVRPDQFIAWAGDTVPDRPHEVLARVTGRRWVSLRLPHSMEYCRSWFRRPCYCSRSMCSIPAPSCK